MRPVKPRRTGYYKPKLEIATLLLARNDTTRTGEIDPVGYPLGKGVGNLLGNPLDNLVGNLLSNLPDNGLGNIVGNLLG